MIQPQRDTSDNLPHFPPRLLSSPRAPEPTNTNTNNGSQGEPVGSNSENRSWMLTRSRSTPKVVYIRLVFHLFSFLLPLRPKINRKSIQSQPNVIKSPSESIREKGLFQDPPKASQSCVFWFFWRHLADFGSHYGPNWIPKGCQNRHFVESSCKNDEKYFSNNETQQNMNFQLWDFPQRNGLRIKSKR